MVHGILCNIFGLSRAATARVEPVPEGIKITIAGPFGNFIGLVSRQTAAALGAELVEVADAKG
jgi:hypothetical protein